MSPCSRTWHLWWWDASQSHRRSRSSGFVETPSRGSRLKYQWTVIRNLLQFRISKCLVIGLSLRPSRNGKVVGSNPIEVWFGLFSVDTRVAFTAAKITFTCVAYCRCTLILFPFLLCMPKSLGILAKVSGNRLTTTPSSKENETGFLTSVREHKKWTLREQV